MKKSLAKNYSILKLKSKFFIYRALIYTSFLLIPRWIQGPDFFNPLFQVTLMVLYIFFMAAQWFLLGKEIDHRLKIYYTVNSSIDRLVYRIFLGKIAFILFFQCIHFFPAVLTKYLFWGTYISLGLFYSWPTRGKIIEETLSRQVTEYKYLDSFEKTILGLTILMFIVSIPNMPSLDNIEALKLYFDPLERISFLFWNFLSIHYFPFVNVPSLYRMAWFLHFYIVGMGTFLLAFYAFLRFFVSRRLAILGNFALISSWSFCLLLDENVGIAFGSSFSLIWIWAFFWCTKSSTYRSGLFLGLLGLWGTIINHRYFFLLPLALILLYFFFLNQKTVWFKRQLLKYSSLGLLLGLLTFLLKEEALESLFVFDWGSYFEQIRKILKRKAFFSLSVLGVLVFILSFFKRKILILKGLSFDSKKMTELFILIGLLFIYSVAVEPTLIEKFFIMWFFSFFGVLPLEWIFQSISRLRSRRNLIYVIYILICLLDSHFEGRVKILINFLLKS